jgi:hypothetical protein
MLPLLQGIFGPGQKPYVVGITTATSTGTPITMTYPDRGRGVLTVAIIARHVGGTAAPALPTGWVSLAFSTTAPAFRLAYKYTDGSEGLTFTSAATSATSMSAIVYAFKGGPTTTQISSPNQGGQTTATSTTPNPGAFAQASINGQIYWLPYAIWNGSGSVVSYPTGFCKDTATVVQSTNGGIAACGRLLPTQSAFSEDIGAFTISASLVNRAGVISIPQLP